MNLRNAPGTVAFFVIALLAKVLLSRALLFASPWAPVGLFSDGALLVGILLVIDLLFPDYRVIALAVADAVITAVLVGTVIYATHYGQIATPALIPLIGQLASVPDAVKVSLSPVLLAYLADFVAVIALLVFRYFGPHDESIQGDDGHHFVRLPLAVYLLAVPLLGIAIATTMTVVALGDTVDDRLVASTDGLFAYQIATLLPRPSHVSGQVDVSDPASVQRRIEALCGGSQSKRLVSQKPGWLKGKNVIFIQVEALQTAAVSARIDGVPVMPHLNSLIQRSWYYPNTVSDIGKGTTVDAEFAENTSLYPPSDTAASLEWSDRKLPSLPRLVEAQGYDALTFHANTVHFWNRKNLYAALGWTRYFDDQYFGREDVIDMGSSDEVMFRKTLDELKRRDASGRPFYAQVITLSSHYPFEALPASKRRLQLPLVYQDTMVGSYLQNMEYADRAIGEFLDGLVQSGLDQNTVVMIVGDHFGLKQFETVGPEGAAQLELFGHMYNEADRMSIPLLVHLPGQVQGVKVEDTAAQIDILPTVADMLGLDLSATPHMGGSVFERGSRLVCPTMFVPPGSYADQNFVFVLGEQPGSGQSWSVFGHADAVVPADALTKVGRAQELLDLSRVWVQAQPRETRSNVDTQSIIPH